MFRRAAATQNEVPDIRPLRSHPGPLPEGEGALMGNSITNFAPLEFSASSTQMRPLCASTMARAIVRPRPLPEGFPWETSPSRIARKNFSKTRYRTSGRIPGPLSSTLSTIEFWSGWLARIVMRDSGGEYFAALSIKV